MTTAPRAGRHPSTSPGVEGGLRGGPAPRADRRSTRGGKEPLPPSGGPRRDGRRDGSFPVVDSDDLWPREPRYRYRLYGQRDGELDVLAAAPTPAALGVALVALDEDARENGRTLSDSGILGVLDVMAPGPRGRWVFNPFPRRRA